MKKKYLGWLVILLVVLFGCSTQEKTEEKEAVSEDGEVTIYLTRHGETMFNVMEKIQGWSDTPLTEEGEEIAEKLGKGLKGEITLDAAYASDLKRAYETGELVLQGMGLDFPVTQMEGLREACTGQFEGADLEEVGELQAKAAGFKDYDAFEKANKKENEDTWSWLANAHFAADQSGYAENSETVKERMKEAILEIGEEQSKKGGGNVLVVSHGMAINILLSDITDKYTGESLKNASVTKIIYKDGELDVEFIGDTSYID